MYIQSEQVFQFAKLSAHTCKYSKSYLTVVEELLSDLWMIHFVVGAQAQVETDASSDSYQFSPEEQQAKELELLAVKKAEAHQLEEALELLNQGVSVAPGYASVYNNRAQVSKKASTISICSLIIVVLCVSIIFPAKFLKMILQKN